MATFTFSSFQEFYPLSSLLNLRIEIPRGGALDYKPNTSPRAGIHIVVFVRPFHPSDLINPCTTGNPFLGTKLLGFSVGRGSGALKGLRGTPTGISYGLGLGLVFL